VALVVALSPAVASQQVPGAATPPKLAVIIVVDQMRADYIERFQGDWTSGLKRLVTGGAWFRDAAYPYQTTVTCAGHATVATGMLPPTHGLIANGWWDRDTQEQVTCTEDPQVTNLGYGVQTKATDSPVRLLVPTLADRLRTKRGAHVVSLSLKADAAIMLAGHGGDVVSWLDDAGANWLTSSTYATAPVPAVQAFVQANPIAADFGKTWDRLLPASHYEGTDDGIAEAPPTGWTRAFPHVLKGTGDKVDATFFVQWARSPFADAYLARFAGAMVEATKLGQHEGTDVLALSFSSPDYVGHAFGPRSQEVQDIYAHLDCTIGELLDRLDMLVGRDQYVVALTADHGVTPLPEQLVVDGHDAGRLNLEVIKGVVERRLYAAWGRGKFLSAVNGTNVYFAPGVYERLKASPATLLNVTARLAALPGVQQVFRSEQLRNGAHSSDRLLRAAALSYVPDRSGDLVLALKPGWMLSATGTTHGSANPDDQRIPIVFYGRGIKAGRYTDAATPADVAPTLAELCGMPIPQANGRALRHALMGAQGGAGASRQTPPGRTPPRG
jgi:predicted AlkP superfamily pyrophosphatase or phosphodiesterase